MKGSDIPCRSAGSQISQSSMRQQMLALLGLLSSQSTTMAFLVSKLLMLMLNAECRAPF